MKLRLSLPAMSKRRTAIGTPLGLGDRIRSAREARGWTQPDLGKAVGVSKSAVSQWEKGAVQNLKLGNLFAVADVLGKDVTELVFGDTPTTLKVTEQRLANYSDPPAQQIALLRAYDSLPKKVRQQLRSLIMTLAANSQDKPG